MVTENNQTMTGLEFQFPQYEAPAWLRNGHLMTIVPSLISRRFGAAIRDAEERQFEVEPGNRVMARCSWQREKRDCPTMLIIHGLEGSADARYVQGIAHKAFAMGMNVLRLNLRNCGDTLHLSTTLYHAGMSADVIAVMRELHDVDGLQAFALVGFSLGGNIVIKAAAELSCAGNGGNASDAAHAGDASDAGDAAHAGGASAAGDGRPLLRAVVGISPSLDLQACVRAIQKPENRLYEHYFVSALKAKIQRKARLQPGIFDLSKLEKVTGIFEFDDTFTALHGGFGSASNYYSTQSALQFVEQIKVPALVIASRDDPMVPFSIFENAPFNTEHVRLLSPQHGGHAGFLARSGEDGGLFDKHWAENRAVQFCAHHCR